MVSYLVFVSKRKDNIMAFWNNKSKDNDVADLVRKVAVVTFGKKYGWICRSKSVKGACNRMKELDEEIQKYIDLVVKNKNNKDAVKQLDSLYEKYLNGGK